MTCFYNLDGFCRCSASDVFDKSCKMENESKYKCEYYKIHSSYETGYETGENNNKNSSEGND